LLSDETFIPFCNDLQLQNQFLNEEYMVDKGNDCVVVHNVNLVLVSSKGKCKVNHVCTNSIEGEFERSFVHVRDINSK
jgi:hypothetical protein